MQGWISLLTRHPSEWIAVAIVFAAIVIRHESLRWIDASDVWFDMVRQFLEHRAKKSLVVPEAVTGDEPVSRLGLPPDIEEELRLREEQDLEESLS